MNNFVNKQGLGDRQYLEVQFFRTKVRVQCDVGVCSDPIILILLDMNLSMNFIIILFCIYLFWHCWRFVYQITYC